MRPSGFLPEHDLERGEPRGEVGDVGIGEGFATTPITSCARLPLR
jgi:hypothetical protein